MKLKQELGKRIVADFHSRAGGRTGGAGLVAHVPEGRGAGRLAAGRRCASKKSPRRTPSTSDGNVQVKLDKLLARTGLATSVTDGLRKVKQNAVKVDGELKTELVVAVKLGTEFTLRAGKKMVRVSVEG